ncbi:MAG: shikimate kinase [Lachnospiraceae bacterium]|nr:shikimate kinase [Lachnospiraceae bacterium]MBO5144000.1 shikimate kinase [Lachnospiraceae bacterium]
MKNIVLIGMPGAGKSTIGVVLAKNLGMSFVDSDLVIQEQEGKKLHELIEEHGLDGFLEIEGRVNASLNPKSAVIATGGSVVYCEEAMDHLNSIAVVCYLRLSYEGIRERLGDLAERGVVLREGQTLKALYEERVPLYEKYANLTVECENKNIREIVMELAKRLR